MMAVMVDSGGRRACYISDLIPTSAHLDVTWVMGYDLYPLTCIEQRKRFLSRAIPEEWLVLFTHDHHHPMGYMEWSAKGKPQLRLCKSRQPNDLKAGGPLLSRVFRQPRSWREQAAVPLVRVMGFARELSGTRAAGTKWLAPLFAVDDLGRRGKIQPLRNGRVRCVALSLCPSAVCPELLLQLSTLI